MPPSARPRPWPAFAGPPSHRYTPILYLIRTLNPTQIPRTGRPRDPPRDLPENAEFCCLEKVAGLAPYPGPAWPPPLAPCWARLGPRTPAWLALPLPSPCPAPSYKIKNAKKTLKSTHGSPCPLPGPPGPQSPPEPQR